MKAIDDDDHAVALLALEVFLQLVDHQAVRVRVEAEEADVEIVLVVEEPNFRPFRARRSRIRLPLVEIGGRGGQVPYRLIQPSVQVDRRLDGRRLRDPSRPNRFVVDVPGAIGGGLAQRECGD